MRKSRSPRLRIHLLFLVVVALLLVFQPVYSNTVDDSKKLKSPLQDPEPIQFVENVLQENDSQDYCNPQGQIKDTCCDYRSVEEIQHDIFEKIQSLVKTKFFRFYKLNLWRECPFWNDDGLCMNRDCSVETTDEASLPDEWRQPALSAVQISPKGSLFQPFQTCQYKDQDFCLIEDESDADGVYVDLTDNPERFTGYAGPSSGRVWKAIYEENCFNIVDKMTEGCETCNNVMHADQSRGNNPLKAAESIAEATNDEFVKVPEDEAKFDRLLNDLAEDPDDGFGNSEEVCLEKRVYYRLISGLHSSISIHICDEYFNQATGTWGPNLDCFVNRIGSHPERLQNIYFTYALVMRAVTKLGNYLEGYTFCTGENNDDMSIKADVLDLINSARACPATFDETTMFQGPDAKSLKLEFRDHFRNVSRIMDCVGCEKCRLWGKIQTTGLGTALKVLFSYGENNLNPKRNPGLLERSEIVALFNTLNRLSESLQSIKKFRQLYHERTHQKVVIYIKLFFLCIG
ncbi:endoplasmic reticulum Oxidoreductin 1-domain-containing protein [Phascolomyces articulosus]|uniref:Endoplasmic reticulum Oxidoreductin 1-domain-containing protein n=1 Tax=Phascolomyces articulosus TaxID=60185 RepID=A0AAD5JMY5_9FUNG|nr:endoplasmic reticulum Oxidoreductin 1-domain-containing protein [Phascolomyces articulosus]